MSSEKMLGDIALIIFLPAFLSGVGLAAAFLTLLSACSQVIRGDLDKDDKEKAEMRLRQTFNGTIRLGFLSIAILTLCLCVFVPVIYFVGCVSLPKEAHIQSSLHLPPVFIWGCGIAEAFVLGSTTWLVLRNQYTYYQDIQLRLPPWLQHRRNQDS